MFAIINAQVPNELNLLKADRHVNIIYLIIYVSEI